MAPAANTPPYDGQAIQRRAWISVAEGLAKQQAAIESSLSRINIAELETAHVRETAHTADLLRAQVASQQRLLNDIKAGLKHVDLWPGQLPAVEAKIRACESQMTRERATHHADLLALQHQEPHLSADVDRAIKQLQPSLAPVCGGSAASPSTAVQSPKENADPQNQPPEVAQFDAFVAKQGRTGGWEEAEHALFLQHVRKSKGDYVLAAAAAAPCLIGRSLDDIRAHSDWHARYQDLEAAKKLAVQKWREQRDRRRQLARLERELNPEPSSLSSSRVLMVPNLDKSSILLQQEQRAQVKEWRERRRTEKACAMEETRRENEIAAAKKSAAEAARLEADRIRLATYRARKARKKRPLYFLHTCTNCNDEVAILLIEVLILLVEVVILLVEIVILLVEVVILLVQVVILLIEVAILLVEVVILLVEVVILLVEIVHLLQKCMLIKANSKEARKVRMTSCFTTQGPSSHCDGAQRAEKEAEAEAEAVREVDARAELERQEVAQRAARAAERAQDMLLKRAALLNDREAARLQRLEQLQKAQNQVREKLEAKVGSSRERVLQPTLAAQQRAREVSEQRAAGAGAGGKDAPLFIRHLPARAAPAWRRTLL
eukprot:jgi/Botrbrau1/20519/Bobra.145_2s0072.1